MRDWTWSRCRSIVAIWSGRYCLILSTVSSSRNPNLSYSLVVGLRQRSRFDTNFRPSPSHPVCKSALGLGCCCISKTYKVSIANSLVNHIFPVVCALIHPTKRTWTVTCPVDNIRAVYSGHGWVGALRLEARASLHSGRGSWKHLERVLVFTQLASYAIGAHELQC